MKYAIIVAMDEKGLIGADNGLPWRLSADLKHFKRLTMGHPMIMGRKTFESIGKPLPGRTNIVLTRDKGFEAEGVVVARSWEEARMAAEQHGQDKCYIIGGAQIYADALSFSDQIHVTEIRSTFKGDTYFPQNWRDYFEVVEREDHENDGLRFSFIRAQKPFENHRPPMNTLN